LRKENILSDRIAVKRKWYSIVAGVVVCAVISALVSGVFGFYLLALIWDMNESALLGVVIGFWVGLIVGTGWSIFLMVKRYAFRKVISYAVFAALLISGLIVLVSTIIIAGLPV
jgi:hypothetical protein